MKEISDYSRMVEEAIAAKRYGAMRPSSLYEPVEYGLQKGGKRLRPVMLLMAGDAFGADTACLTDAAVGIEMFHNFTLLHDDVMDRSDMRRGRPTVHRRWDENTAILSGDTMLTLASSLMRQVPDKCLRGVLETFDAMAVEVYEGQRLDMDFEERDDVSVEQYLEMIEKKTSALLGASARIGAYIAGASEADCALMYEYGVKLGIAFQIQDDYLDLYGDPATFGKPIGGDVLNGKKTFLTVSALALGDGVAEEVRSGMALPADAEKIEKMRSVYDRAGIPEICREAIARYSGEAVAALNATAISEENRLPLEQLVDRLIHRRK